MPQWIKKKNHIILVSLRITLSCSIFFPSGLHIPLNMQHIKKVSNFLVIVLLRIHFFYLNIPYLKSLMIHFLF